MTRLLEIENLKVEFPSAQGLVKAVDGIAYTVDAGETVALVGESGCGKSMSALAVLGLVPDPGRVVGGAVRFAGRDLLELPEDQIVEIRGREIAMIFQEPMTSLNPVLSIGVQLREGMRRHLRLSRADAEARAIELLRLVGIGDAERRMRQYPHHLSGGMRQRVMIAVALGCEPKVIIADEPTTALDVTIQAQILELMKDLSRRLGVALVLITHNLGVVARYADRVNVMYAGRIVETGVTRDLLDSPRHPYTRGLLESTPQMDNDRHRRLEPIPGSPRSLHEEPSACPFAARCAHVHDRCHEAEPPAFGVRELRCWLAEEAR